jgi:hypothetical protein
MKFLAVKNRKGSWAFATEGGTPWKSCANHGFIHETSDDANFCFWEYALMNSKDVEQAPIDPATGEKSASMCQFLGCMKTTLRALVNEVCPMGKHLCDQHRRIFTLVAIMSFVGGGDGKQASYSYDDGAELTF